MINLSSFIAFHARQTPERCALKYSGEEISYAAFNKRIRIVAGWLASRGIGPDDVVAVLMKNSAAFLDIAFAVSHIGAVFLPINYRLASDEVAYIVENAGARLLVADEEFSASAAGSAPIVLVDVTAQSNASHLAPNAKPVAAHPRRPSDLMRLMYTSGTTDRPKGVMLTYENIYWKSADHVLALGLSRETRLLVTGPLYHVGALDPPGIAVLYLTDRKKDIIISGGENIASSEVERVIQDLPQVCEVAVIGMPDARWGERPVAIVVLADRAALEFTDLNVHCRKRLAAFKVPRQMIIRDSLPRNPSGKVLKRVLRAELEANA